MLADGEGHLGVIGGGFIGVEAAASARMKGLDVTMAVPESVVWEHLFGAEVGRYFQRQLENHGVTVLTGTEELPERAYNLVLAGIGVDANIEPGQGRRARPSTSGVLMDEHLSAGNDIWAVGDIAEYQSVIHGKRIRIEHWDVALNQGAYVGRVWAGKEDRAPTTSCRTSSPTSATGRGSSTSGRAGQGRRPRVDGRRRLRRVLHGRQRSLRGAAWASTAQTTSNGAKELITKHQRPRRLPEQRVPAPVIQHLTADRGREAAGVAGDLVDRDDRQRSGGGRTSCQLRPAGHRAVLVHHLAQHAAGREAGEPGQIDRRLGLAAALEHPARAGPQREHVAGPV